MRNEKKFLPRIVILTFFYHFPATSPYMAVGANAEKCIGPGVCTGHGMPAEVAVCQFPQATQEKYEQAGIGKSYVINPAPKGSHGPGVCPGADVCPACKDDIVHHLRVPPAHGRMVEQPLNVEKPFVAGLSPSNENLLAREAHSMVLLPKDLDDLRQKVKVRAPTCRYLRFTGERGRGPEL